MGNGEEGSVEVEKGWTLGVTGLKRGCSTGRGCLDLKRTGSLGKVGRLCGIVLIISSGCSSLLGVSGLDRGRDGSGLCLCLGLFKGSTLGLVTTACSS